MANERDKPSMKRVLAKASIGPLNILVAGSAALGALAMHSWPLLALGGAAYTALVAWDAANPKFWKKLYGAPGAAPPPALPDPTKIADGATRKAVQGILAARAELARVLAETPAEVSAHLDSALGSVVELESRAARLAARAADLAGYLASVDGAAVRAERDRLDGEARRTADDEARREYEQARAAREEHLRALDDVSRVHDRIVANLARLGATLEALPAKIVRMRALDAQAMDSLSGDMNEELDSFNLELRSFEETLKSLVEVPAS